MATPTRTTDTRRPVGWSSHGGEDLAEVSPGFTMDGADRFHVDPSIQRPTDAPMLGFDDRLDFEPSPGIVERTENL